MPHALAEAIGLEAGEQVQWEVLDRGELHLVRSRVPPPRAQRRAGRSKK
jgi:antitoxin component of MazEF toxin-antitoxin module